MTPRTVRRARVLGAALLTWLSAGCGGGAPETQPEPAALADPCLLPTGRPGKPRELTVAVPWPGDTGVVARRQPQPLIRLDCTGAARPAVAESWSRDRTGRTWTLVVAGSALHVSAAAAAAEWRTRPAAATTLRHAGVVSVVPLDQRRLVVTLDRSYDSVPLIFADPALALVTDSGTAAGTSFTLRLVSGDARDALDAGADLLTTDDTELLDYARARDDLVVHPLPWSRVYVLAIPPGQRGFEDLIPADTAPFRTDLSQDAVRVEARAAEVPFWWTRLGRCPERERGPASATGQRVTTPPLGDPIGRAIAERLVALSGRPMRVSDGMYAHTPVTAIRSELGTAYVIPVPTMALVPCREIAAWPAGATVVPLIETRRSVVVRRGVPPITVDFDGRLRAVETR
ncbi:MAG TPA: hypothetical protein VJ794_01030 [Gemmatimonadales bacterium]|nr:hypothetical protein [Gemmatimonadales bacterium]